MLPKISKTKKKFSRSHHSEYSRLMNSSYKYIPVYLVALETLTLFGHLLVSLNCKVNKIHLHLKDPQSFISFTPIFNI